MKESVRTWLLQQFGDEDVAREIYDEYRRSTAPKFQEAAAALAAGDCPSLDRIAHALKGNALMIADQEALDAALALRDAAKAGDASAAETALARARAVFGAD